MYQISPLLYCNTLGIWSISNLISHVFAKSSKSCFSCSSSVVRWRFLFLSWYFIRRYTNIWFINGFIISNIKVYSSSEKEISERSDSSLHSESLLQRGVISFLLILRKSAIKCTNVRIVTLPEIWSNFWFFGLLCFHDLYIFFIIDK